MYAPRQPMVVLRLDSLAGTQPQWTSSAPNIFFVPLRLLTDTRAAMCLYDFLCLSKSTRPYAFQNFLITSKDWWVGPNTAFQFPANVMHFPLGPFAVTLKNDGFSI